MMNKSELSEYLHRAFQTIECGTCKHGEEDCTENDACDTCPISAVNWSISKDYCDCLAEIIYKR